MLVSNLLTSNLILLVSSSLLMGCAIQAYAYVRFQDQPCRVQHEEGDSGGDEDDGQVALLASLVGTACTCPSPLLHYILLSFLNCSRIPSLLLS